VLGLTIRRHPPLQMMDAIYTLLMKTVHDRFHRLQRTTTMADVPLAKFNDRLQSSRRYRVFDSGNWIYQVQIPDSGRKFIVNLKERRCDCMNFQEYLSPCTHAIVERRCLARSTADIWQNDRIGTSICTPLRSETLGDMNANQVL